MITPRRTRLLRVADLAAFRATLIDLTASLAPAAARDTFLLVPTRAAGEQLRRTLGDLLSAIHAQPKDMRERLVMHVHSTMTDWARPVPEREPPDRDRNRQI